MAHHRLRARRIEPGVYELTYGRGIKKIVAVARTIAANQWQAVEQHVSDYHAITVHRPTLRELKQAFQAAAEAVYGRDRSSVPCGSPEPVETAADDSDQPVRQIDGIEHRYHPPSPTAVNQLCGPWCWIGSDGLNVAQRRTQAYLERHRDELLADDEPACPAQRGSRRRSKR